MKIFRDFGDNVCLKYTFDIFNEYDYTNLGI